MNTTDFYFGALMGNKMIQRVEQFSIIQNEAQKRVLPMPQFSMDTRGSRVTGTAFDAIPQQQQLPPSKESQFFPLSFSVDEGQTWFTLPYEPMLNVNGKNILIKRYVAKWHAEASGKLFGSIKERWSQDDYTIDIAGALWGSIETGKVDECFPRSDFEKLKTIMTNPKEVWVACPPLELLGINRIAIEDFSFPFTKGENVQAYTIKVYSDSSYNLLIDL